MSVTRGDLPWKMFGRTLKPVAFAQMLALLVLAVAYVERFEREPGTDTIAGVLFAAAAGTGAGLLFAGWVRGSQRLAEWGLLFAAGVWIARAALVLLTGYGDDPVAFWLSLCWAIAAGGAFLLESIDEEVEGIWTRPSHKPSPH